MQGNAKRFDIHFEKVGKGLNLPGKKVSDFDKFGSD